MKPVPTHFRPLAFKGGVFFPANSRVTFMNIAKFIREVRHEATKVTWPSRKETGISTMMVLIMVSFASVFFLVVDMALSHGVRWILGI